MRPTIIGLLLFSICCWQPKAQITRLRFGNNDTAYPPKQAFAFGEKVFAVASVINIEEGAKLKYVLTTVHVAGVNDGQELQNTTVDVPSSRSVRIDLLGLTKPGEFKLDVTLINRHGAAVDTSTGTFTISPK